ncbi:MAG TPA: hypothetical protein VKB69_15090 [Micromonosporaceae bacterium]|nr:hypothetical protein [Micromonosporaceae bacterium]
MPAPTLDPGRRDPRTVASANTYCKADPVWVYRGGWHAGIVENASARAAMVTYRPAGSRGTCVDTFTAESMYARADRDPQLDRFDPNLRRPAA